MISTIRISNPIKTHFQMICLIHYQNFQIAVPNYLHLCSMTMSYQLPLCLSPTYWLDYHHSHPMLQHDDPLVLHSPACMWNTVRWVPVAVTAASFSAVRVRVLQSPQGIFLRPLLIWPLMRTLLSTPMLLLLRLQQL